MEIRGEKGPEFTDLPVGTRITWVTRCEIFCPNCGNGISTPIEIKKVELYDGYVDVDLGQQRITHKCKEEK